MAHSCWTICECQRRVMRSFILRNHKYLHNLIFANMPVPIGIPLLHHRHHSGGSCLSVDSRAATLSPVHSLLMRLMPHVFSLCFYLLYSYSRRLPYPTHAHYLSLLRDQERWSTSDWHRRTCAIVNRSIRGISIKPADNISRIDFYIREVI